jgi:hypothetical protein
MTTSILESRIVLPTDIGANLAYIQSADGVPPSGALSFLHRVRSDVGKRAAAAYPEQFAQLREAYLRAEPSIAAAYEQWSRSKEISTVVRIPSSRCDAAPFLSAILRGNPQARDLSEFFTKDSDWSAGGSPHFAFSDAMTKIRWQGIEPHHSKTLVIVDESLNQGTSAAIVVRHLESAGVTYDALWLVAPLVLRDLSAAL